MRGPPETETLMTARLLLLAVLLLATPAAATDLCFNDAGGNLPVFVFKKVKLPTKPLDARPLVGLGLSGTAHTSEGGSLSFLVTTAAKCIIAVGFDGQLVGTASTACMNGSASVTTWHPVDC
jgi:hypothetical protein